jgi:hypothetical protein
MNEKKTIVKSHVCGVSCHQGGANCNGYCTTQSIPRPGTYELALMDIGGAVADLEAGHCVKRVGWHADAMFVFLRPGDTLSKAFLQIVKTLPASAKALLMGLGRDVEFLPCLCLMNEQGQVVNGWQPGQVDSLAKDWVRVV